MGPTAARVRRHWELDEGDGWVIYEEAAVVKSSGQAPESAGWLPRKRPL